MSDNALEKLAESISLLIEAHTALIHRVETIDSNLTSGEYTCPACDWDKLQRDIADIERRTRYLEENNA